MPFLLGVPILAMLWYWLVASGSWNGSVGLALLVIVLFASLRWLRRHARLAHPAFVAAAILCLGASLASCTAAGDARSPDPSTFAIMAFGLGVLFALLGRAVNEGTFEEVFAGASCSVDEAVGAIGPERASVCPRCHNTGMYWAALSKPCPLHHRPGARCWACEDTGSVQQNEPIVCVHLDHKLS